jgi:CRP-like cAMP-binding protein
MKKRGFLDDISLESLQQMVPCFQPNVKNYRKGDTILTYGDSSGERIAVLSEGRARLDVLTPEGDAFRLESIEEGEVFGEMFSLPLDACTYIVRAETDCRVIYLDYQHVITPCFRLCPHHTQLISNLFVMAAQKTQALSFHLSILNQHTTRDKLLCYLRYARHGVPSSADGSFEIPISLSSLAEYLGVDRSAMMREIRAMKADGLLESDRRTFRLLTE